jgi:hypothetical protein
MHPLRALAAATLAALSLGAHAVGRLGDLAIYDRATGRELAIHHHEGRAYVVGQPGNEYQVVLRSRAANDLLAVVSVDGVNVMSGETASPRQGGYVVSPGSRLAVRGWRKTLDEVAAFYFTSLGDSYAARTQRPENVGVIGVALFQRLRRVPELSVGPAPMLKRDGNTLDQTAESRPSAQAAPSAPLGTGHGRREESAMRWVDFERATAAPAETLAIYYDSYRNLVARGILATPSPRDPDPFPTAFAPDPPRW